MIRLELASDAVVPHVAATLAVELKRTSPRGVRLYRHNALLGCPMPTPVPANSRATLAQLLQYGGTQTDVLYYSVSGQGQEGRHSRKLCAREVHFKVGVVM